ncbi:MAG: hypothetical protein A3A24_00910 [Candidatus Buchananbacteria bacterium RIFCSPLOWO2_01_FULL_46_12]|uniref:DUF916 domain-containing protein n=1 Tax=Candidatus Buchananbacteria bacterium RIFCSPLOWO2_01_FULL_46_12 TaxID=1797546 RepID=A0A1G1YPI4_9BACT|nr:MAG: hypothetical protein A3A24_00910 [Candidatus Buchananbacteria bacterium RIFCSPLOWO2_01_FULL_46_12]
MKKSIFLFALFLWLALPGSASATTIFSPLLELAVAAGSEQTGVVKVYNETDQPLFLTASVASFTTSGETGQADFFSADQTADYLDWFQIAQPELILQPKQVAIVPFTVTVPPSALPGGYYAAILWRSAAEPAVSQSAVGVNSQVGTLVFLKVTGSVIEQGEISDFYASPAKEYFFSFPISFITRFSNTGNIHLRPQGEIKLTGWLGQKKSLDFNAGQRNVLPSSVRRFDVLWGSGTQSTGLVGFWQEVKQELKNFTIGPYTATLTLSYGADNVKTVSQKLNFWFLPYRSLAVFVLIVLLVFSWRLIDKKIKRMKNRDNKKPA